MVEKISHRALPWRRILQVLGASLGKFLEEDSLMVSASIAYYGLLCVFPLLLLLSLVGGVYVQHHELSGRLAILLERYLPVSPDVILENVVAVSRAYGRIGLVSFLLLVWGSSGVFLPVETALNRAWEVERPRSWWLSRLLALEMTLISALFVALSLLLVGINAYLQAKMRQLALTFPTVLIGFSYRLLISGATYGMTLLMFLIVMARLPNQRLRLRQVFPSALLTALLWELARALFTHFLPRFNYRHVYGSIGALVAFMTWIYISAAVTLFGAQVSSALYRTLERP
jgi:YihY family inner membrane protein